MSVGLCDYRGSGANRIDRVDGGSGRNVECNYPVAHCLVLHVSDGEDKMSQLPVSAVRMDRCGVGIELH